VTILKNTTEVLASNAMNLCNDLFKIPRAIVSEGNLRSFEILENYLTSKISYIDIPSGTGVNGWIVPDAWNLLSASLISPNGEELIDMNFSNLHVVVGSRSINERISLSTLKKHLHTRPDLPSAIPYVTSYYENDWGFCLPYTVFKDLAEGEYIVSINTSTPKSFMRLGEIFIKGNSEKEIFFSTYFCHPQMANNELSGPAVWMSLVNYLQEIAEKGSLEYSYRFYIGPETIGAIHYLNLKQYELKSNMKAGFVLTCVGVDTSLMLMPSRSGNSFTDRLVKFVLSKYKFNVSDFNSRGSDERHWCSPAVNLPVCSIMTKKYHEYPEYHTSLDDLDFISVNGFEKVLAVYVEIVDLIERNLICKNTNIGEPRLDKLGIYPTINSVEAKTFLVVRNVLNILNLLDGTNDTIEISKLLDLSFDEVDQTLRTLLSGGVVEIG